MADRRRNRKKLETQTINDDVDKPDKLEYEIAKYLRSKLPPKQTTLLGHKVDYFISSKSIDLLMASKWAQTDKRSDRIVFSSRESVVDFLNTMLRHKFFHRAKTIIVKKEIKKKIDTDDESNKKSREEKKEKKKVKLDMHMEQIFIDSNEPYVWIYDYIPIKTWLIGGGLVLAAIAICLFPLWPRTVRNYVYYLSIAVAVFLFFIIALALLKMIIFALVWVFTLGRHQFWILPNLTEDVGFFESFWPLYKHECKNDNSRKNSNNEELLNAQKDIPENKTNESESQDEEKVDSEAESVSTQESNAKSTNGFEILDSNELAEN